MLPVLLDAKVVELELNNAKGWRGGDVTFLKELRNLEVLDLLDFAIQDISPIHALASLRELGVSTYCRTPIDFGCFPLLETCGLEWRAGCRTLFACRTLRCLVLIHCKERDFRNLGRLDQLTILRLLSSPLHTLDGIERLSHLRLLGIARSRALTSVAGLERLQNLESLSIEGSRRLTDVSPIAGAKKLRELELLDIGDVPSLRPLLALGRLELLALGGSTRILDGDLGTLLMFPNLKDARFMDRPTYSHTRDQVKALLGARQ